MKSMNRQMNLPAMQKIMSEFEKESEIMDMKEDMMNDVIDDTMAEENDEEESDEIVNQILDEIGISLDQSVRYKSLFPRSYFIILFLIFYFKILAGRYSKFN